MKSRGLEFPNLSKVIPRFTTKSISDNDFEEIRRMLFKIKQRGFFLPALLEKPNRAYHDPSEALITGLISTFKNNMNNGITKKDGFSPLELAQFCNDASVAMILMQPGFEFDNLIRKQQPEIIISNIERLTLDLQSSLEKDHNKHFFKIEKQLDILQNTMIKIKTNLASAKYDYNTFLPNFKSKISILKRNKNLPIGMILSAIEKDLSQHYRIFNPAKNLLKAGKYIERKNKLNAKKIY